VVVISEGLGADWLREKKHEHHLSNLELFDFQPFAQMPDVLGSADVLLAILEPDAGIYSAPSKVLTYLCAERALLLAIPPENLSAQIVSQHSAGLVVPPQHVLDFLQAADRLLTDTELRQTCARNGRAYAENTFDIARIGDLFVRIILD
jgi:glycosyltransferase involved in cell wall biosynthesis